MFNYVLLYESVFGTAVWNVSGTWRSEDRFVESLSSFHLRVGSGETIWLIEF